jgi:demethylmenaquinone methyltransferase/2-methoxy-6-polyprenyl-1,4-benzoquinol methylase
VVGVDVTKEYLDVALGKARRLGIRNVEFIHSRAEDILLDQRFDCVTASYLPKYADLEKLARVLKDTLKPGGTVVMHDFTYPTRRWTAALWEFYFKILRAFGNRFYPEWGTVFDELPALLRKTTWVPDLVAGLEKNGFTDIRVERLIINAATIVTARNSTRV